MRANVMKLWMAIGAVAVISGCSCNPPTECEDLFVTFDSPKDGAIGVPATTEVTIKVANGTGAAIELDSAQLVTRASAASEFSAPHNGVLTAGQATFSGVTLEPGPNVLKVSVKKKGTACTGTKTITVEVPLSNDAPKVLTFAYPQDTAMPTGVLNGTELPSAADLRIDLTTQFAIGGSVQIFNEANNQPVGNAFTVVNSAVSVQIPAAALADNGYTFFAKVSKGTLSNTATGNPEAVKSITLARTAPTCAVTLPNKAILGPNDDADSVKAGYQLRLSGTAGTLASTIELKLSGGAAPATSGPQPLVSGGLSRDFDVPNAGSTLYTVTVEAKDAQGNVCLATRQVTVDFDPPTCVITSPTAAGSPYANFSIPLSATVTGGEGGKVEFSTSLPSNRQLSPALLVTNGMSAAYTGAFTAGAQTVTARCTDLGGNSASTTQNITVSGTAGCSIYFLQPRSKPALVTSPAYTVSVQTSCPGQTVTLKQTAAADRTAVAGSTGVASFSITGLTSGTFTWTAQVGTPVNSDMVDVTVDLNAPLITRPTASSSLGYALLNVASDLAPGTAGAQSLLTYTATVPAGGRVDVCSNQTPAPANASACADGVAGWWALKTDAAASEPTFTFPEGAYSIKLVVVVGTTAQATSAPVDVVVDVTAPVLTNFKFVGDINNDKLLNLAEFAGTAPQVSFDLGTGNPAASITEVRVFDTVAYNTAPSFASVGQAFTVTLNQNLSVPLNQAFSLLTVEATDSAGNKGGATMANAKVDQVPPTCVITLPALSLLGGPNDADSATAGFQLRAQISTSSDVPQVLAGLGGAQTGSGNATPMGGLASINWTLTQTNGVQSYNLTATCTDDALNATVAAPRNGISVDLEAPTCTITAPVASPPQYLNFGVPTSVTVTGAATPSTVRVFSQVAAMARTQRANLAIAGGVAAGTVPYVGGVQAVTAEVDDVAGNTGTCGPVSIDVNASGCDIAFTTPALKNGQYFLNALPFTVTGHTSNCGAGRTVKLFRVGTATELGNGTTNASGDVSIQGTLAEGGPYALRLEIDNGGGVLNTADLSPVTVDVTAPGVGTTTPTGTTLNFVAATNVNLPAAAYVQDLTAGAPADFTVTVLNITGALGGEVRVLFKGAQVGAAVAITADPQASISFNTALPHNDTGAFEIQVLDEAGNISRPTNATATVDVIAPAAPTVTAVRTDARAATMALSWAATYDDGTTVASGAHAGYDIRWTTDAVTGANALATSADYFNSARANPESLEPWSASAINRNLTLPPFNNYYIVVRAKDELGNYSSYVAPSAFDNRGTQDALTNPTGTAGQSFGRLVASSGSLNGDAIDDLVTASTTLNTVYVYFGRTGFTASATCTAPNCQSIVIPVTASGDNFGADFSVGNAGDTAAPDLLVSSSSFTTNTGRAFLFFGGANPIDSATFIEFRGPSTGVFFGRTVEILPDINQDGIGEVAIMDNENSGRARIYIYKGRSKAAWQTLAAGTFVPTTKADAIIEGPSPLTGNTFFGFARDGYASLGDLDGDGNGDFGVPCPRDNVNKLFLMSGATVSGSTLAAPVTTGVSPGIASQTLQELTASGAGTGSSSGFSKLAIGGLNFLGATGNDLLVSQPQQQRVMIYSDIVLPLGAANVTITGANLFGSSGGIGKFRSVSAYDLALSENSALATSAVWLFYVRQGSFDGVAGGGFWQSTTSGPANATTGIFGSSVVTGDFDNDTKSDLAMVDPSTSPGRVLVWH